MKPLQGYLPTKMTPDPHGYFVVYVDRRRHMLVLEHYRNEGVLNAIIEGRTPAEMYIPAAERGFLSRLEHAAYLGRELAKAEDALRTGTDYVQDGAPEISALPASSSCNGGRACPSDAT